MINLNRSTIIYIMFFVVGVLLIMMMSLCYEQGRYSVYQEIKNKNMTLVTATHVLDFKTNVWRPLNTDQQCLCFSFLNDSFLNLPDDVTHQ
jgi:hypothetical protein